MRTRRGLWAAVGAGTALAAAGLAVLVVVSVVLAVHGWPQVSSADGSARVTLRAEVAAERPGAAAAAPAPVVLPRRVRAITRHAVTRPAARRRAATTHGR